MSLIVLGGLIASVFACLGSGCQVNNGSGEVCGNGVCGTGENVSNCAQDCGGGGETCGNGVCGSGENTSNCPSDCGEGPDCSADAGDSCPVDYEAQAYPQFAVHGPGACENTGTEPGPSLESLSTSLPSQVSPGQSVTFTVNWNRCNDCNQSAVIYSSFLGDWQLSTPLKTSSGYFTSCDETAQDSVTFTAPSTPGKYKVRWILCFAFDSVKNFCGDGPVGTSDNPGSCPFIEKTFTVCP